MASTQTKYSMIPAELQTLPQWVGARITPSQTAGKTNKLPICSATGAAASSTDPTTWSTFDQALAAVQRYGLQGIGLVFSPSDPYCGIDLDHCLDAAGNLTPAAQQTLDLLDSYTERSQSGTGLHVICRAVLPPGGRHSKTLGEMYDSGRFFVTTGDVLPGYTSIEDRQDAVETLHATWFPPVKTHGGTPRQPTAISLSDADLLAKATNAGNGAKFCALYAGDWAGEKSQSEADLALCAILCFWTGGDAARIDSMFRQSALYRAKWDEKHGAETYGDMTIRKAIDRCLDFYHGSNGTGPNTPPTNTPTPTPTNTPTNTPPAPAPAPKRKRKQSQDLVDFLASKGYTFRLNQCDDSVEVSGERISDVTRSQMRCALRDAGMVKFLAAADDALVADAARHAYHPVRDYLAGLTWDNLGHIDHLARHATDVNNVFGLYLRKWLIGAVARAYTGCQNAVLVLDGPQGLGKSQFVKWLCPLPQLFVDASIDPENKDCSLLAMRNWIWEVSELGATTKRADVEALKGFLSREVFTVRAPFGHFEIHKPGLASFVGTVNNSAGIFSDTTGSRRYWATTLTTLDWGYTQNVNLAQVWAEAAAAYHAGEKWTLTPTEAVAAHAINTEYACPDPVEDLLRKHFKTDPARVDKWTSSADILTTLQNNGLGQSAKANSMHLAATLKRLGHVSHKQADVRGYLGVWA